MSGVDYSADVDRFMTWVVERNRGEPEFHQAVASPGWMMMAECA
jgi:hypothetical protein